MTLLALLLLWAVAADRARATIVSPDPTYDVSLAVVHLKNGKRVSWFAEAPVEHEDGSTTIDLGQTILQHRGRVVSILAGPAMAERSRFRRTAGHAVKRSSGGRFVAILEPTASGYTFVQWSAPVVGGQACIPEFARAHYRVTFAVPRSADANGDICVEL